MIELACIGAAAIAFAVMVAGGAAAMESVDMDGLDTNLDADHADRLGASPLPCKVCPNCSAYYLGVRCASCGWTDPDSDHECPPTGVPCGRCEIPVGDEDAADGDEATDLESPFDDGASGEQP